MNDKHIILNRIKTPDGTILTSYYRHDYKVYKDKNGMIYMVDGGNDYLRRNANEIPHIELSVFNTDDFRIIRDNMHWGTRGKDGKSPLQWVLLKHLTTNHIRSIIETQKQLPEWKIDLFIKELDYRKDLQI